MKTHELMLEKILDENEIQIEELIQPAVQEKIKKWVKLKQYDYMTMYPALRYASSLLVKKGIAFDHRIWSKPKREKRVAFMKKLESKYNNKVCDESIQEFMEECNYKSYGSARVMLYKLLNDKRNGD